MYAQVPPKVEYSLTGRGRSLLPHLNGLIDWAKGEMDGILHDREALSASRTVC